MFVRIEDIVRSFFCLRRFGRSRGAAKGGRTALPDYEVLDLSVSYDATDKLQLYGRVQNATGEIYEEVRGFFAAERSVYGGVRLRF